jgi:hypothetical protein
MIRLEGGIEGERQRDRAGTLYFTLGLCSVQNVISCLDKNKKIILPPSPYKVKKFTPEAITSFFK